MNEFEYIEDIFPRSYVGFGDELNELIQYDKSHEKLMEMLKNPRPGYEQMPVPLSWACKTGYVCGQNKSHK